MHTTFTCLLNGLWLIQLWQGATLIDQATAKTWLGAESIAYHMLGGE